MISGAIKNIHICFGNTRVYQLDLIKNPYIVGGWSLIFCYFCTFFLSDPFYVTNDELIMRGLLSGKHFSDGYATEFTLYMSHWVGYIIKYMYIKFPSVNSYEIFFYAILSISTFTILYNIASVIEDIDLKSVIILYVVLPSICSVPFVARHFTITAGILFCSSIITFWTLINSRVSFFKCVYVVISIVVSSLLRFDATMAYGLVATLILLPLMPWENIKKVIILVSIAFISLLSSVGIEYHTKMTIESNQLWNYRQDMNKYFTSIFNDSVFAHIEDLYAAWEFVEENDIDFGNLENGAVWGKERQNLLLHFAILGEPDVYGLENMHKVSEALKEGISYRHARSLFPILYQNLKMEKVSYWIWILVWVILMFPSKKVFRISIYFILCFTFVCMLITFLHRPVPYRLWYGFALEIFSILFVYILSINKVNRGYYIINNLNLNMVVTGILTSGIVYSSLYIPYKTWDYSKFMGKITDSVISGIQDADKDFIYLVDGLTFYFSGSPFREEPWGKSELKYIILTSTLLDTTHYLILDKYNIDIDDPLLDICGRDDVRFICAPKKWRQNFYDMRYHPFFAIAEFMKNHYGIEVGAVDTSYADNDKIVIFQISQLDDREKNLRQKLRDIMELKKNSSNEYMVNLMIQYLLHSYIRENSAMGMPKLAYSMEKVLSFIENPYTATSWSQILMSGKI